MDDELKNSLEEVGTQLSRIRQALQDFDPTPIPTKKQFMLDKIPTILAYLGNKNSVKSSNHIDDVIRAAEVAEEIWKRVHGIEL